MPFKINTSLVLGEASGLGKNIKLSYPSALHCSEAPSSDVRFAGFKSFNSSYFSRVKKFLILYRRLNHETADIIFIMNTFRMFPSRLDFLNYCILLICAIFWRGRKIYVVAGGTHNVLWASRHGNIIPKDFYYQFKKEKISVFNLFFLKIMENFLLNQSNKILCISSFYKEIYSNFSNVKEIELPLHDNFFSNKPYKDYLSWKKKICSKFSDQNRKAEIAYIYRTERKGSREILQVIEKLKAMQISVDVYHNVEFEQLGKILNNYPIIIDATSGPKIGYLGSLALFNGTIVCSSFNVNEADYGGLVFNISLDNLQCQDKNKYLREQIILARRFAINEIRSSQLDERFCQEYSKLSARYLNNFRPCEI